MLELASRTSDRGEGRRRPAVAAGQTTARSATSAFISEKTVSVHVSNAMAKLERSPRYEAAAAAERRACSKGACCSVIAA